MRVDVDSALYLNLTGIKRKFENRPDLNAKIIIMKKYRRCKIMKNLYKINMLLVAIGIVALSISAMAGTGHELTLNATKDHPAAKA